MPPGFCGLENDVFISYAHADNTLGWVTAFEFHLTARLNELRRNAGFQIWRDPRLGGAYVLSPEITARLKSCGVLISILSPNGLDADWCQRERTLFEQSAARKGGLVINNKARTLRITKTPCPNNKDRDLFGTVGHDFYTGHIPSFAEIDQDSPEFRAAVLKIAQEVFDVLTELQQKRATAAAAPELTVYLAAPPPNTTAAEWRQRVANELTGARNCRVLPENPDPTQLSIASITELLNSSDLCLHWETAAAPPTKPLTDTLQWECALAASSIKRVTCEVATGSTNPAPAPPTSSTTPGDERIRATAPDEIIQYFEDLIKARRTAAAPNPAGQRPLVYVICGPDEIEDALRLKHCLENESRFAAILPIRDTTDGKARLADHRNWLKTCQHALLYWGRSSQHSWFREQQREIIAAQVKRKVQPLRALCLASSNTADPSSDALPNLPLQKIAGIECAVVRSCVKHWEPEKSKGAFSL